ncbi:MAG: hypothetical protein K8S21_13610 [Gemmatimonadetes bacterium]|nr:hypothetical protein [Gemmatimonadota bacterium]
MPRSARRKHLDGSICPEGTRSVPRGFRPCCDEFAARTLACFFDIRYEWWSGQRNWFVLITPEAGGGGIAMAHCPHCGAKLKGGAKRGRYLRV